MNNDKTIASLIMAITIINFAIIINNAITTLSEAIIESGNALRMH